MFGYPRSGLCLYLFALFIAYKTDTFELLRQWPLTAKIVLYAGPAELLLGLYFDSIKPHSWMLTLVFVHILAQIIAYFDLKVLNQKS